MINGESKLNVHCLLVDDQEPNLIALDSLLRGEGVTLLKARSGTEALELLLQYDVALAFVDVQMPGMDGFELAELMRGTERTHSVPIIFLTAGSTDQQRRFRGYGAGAVDFLQKPIETEVLKSKAEVFFDLYRQRQVVAMQRDKLAAMIAENSRLLDESRTYAAALQDADRRKDEFLATLAHELRNPLAPILNAVQLIRSANCSAEEMAEIHEIVDRQATHMVRLVDDLLEVSRITNGKIQLQCAEVSLADVVRNAVETSRPLIEASGLELRVRLPAERLVVDGDVVRLTQVLANLLNNAAKYTADGGQIFLTVEQIEGDAAIRVRDTGLGIPPAMLGEVFQMFTQINRHLKRAQGGLGIGLTLVKRLVELHGGSVEVASEGENRGAEFTVRLPLSRQSAEGVVATSSEQASEAGSQRVVVIDDNADAIRVLTLLLKAQGHQVASAQSGREGLELVTQFQPSFVFLDLGMPEMDGFETARRIRELPVGKDLKLVALTGWGQEEQRTRTREAGFDQHLVKPVDSDVLKTMLTSE